MIGMKMPPARAVVEGMAGAMQASATARPYASPSVLLPNARTNKVATRSPSPVFSKPYSKREGRLTDTIMEACLVSTLVLNTSDLVGVNTGSCCPGFWQELCVG